MKRRTVIITGATKGLGRAMAIEFCQSGCQVIGTYSSDDDAADQMRLELAAISNDSLIIKHDVRSDPTRILDSVEIANGVKLTLINNACAPFTPQPFHLVRWDDVQRALDTGLKGSWLCSQGVIKTMIRQGEGTIVNVLSTAVFNNTPKGFSAYLVAKHAMRGLTLALAAEYSGKGIRIFSVSPGYMATALTSKWDSRLVEMMNGDPSNADPLNHAAMIRKNVEDLTLPGQGENYSV